MHEMLQMSAPWWIYVVRGSAIYVFVLLMMRLSGKRAMGQFTPFDLILLILIGNSVQNGINGGDNSLTGAFVMTGTVFALNWVIAWLSSRSETFRALVEGRPSVLAADGKVDRAMLRRQLVSDADFVNAMHLAGCASEKDIRKAILQPNGHIMIQTTDGKWG